MKYPLVTFDTRNPAMRSNSFNIFLRPQPKSQRQRGWSRRQHECKCPVALDRQRVGVSASPVESRLQDRRRLLRASVEVRGHRGRPRFQFQDGFGDGGGEDVEEQRHRGPQEGLDERARHDENARPPPERRPAPRMLHRKRYIKSQSSTVLLRYSSLLLLYNLFQIRSSSFSSSSPAAPCRTFSKSRETSTTTRTSTARARR